MSCPEFSHDLMDLAREAPDAARRREVSDHLAQCTECSAALAAQRGLTAQLSAAAATDDIAEHLEKILVRAFRRAHRPVLLRPVRWAAPLAVAAALVLFVATGLRPVKEPKARQSFPARSPNAFRQEPIAKRPTIAPRPRPLRAGAPEPEYFLAFDDQMPIEMGMVVRVDLSDGGRAIEADVLLGEDGMPRGIRFLP